MNRQSDFDFAKFLPPNKWFDRWWMATKFAESVRTHKQSVPVAEFMTRSELKPLREAWVAARFAAIRSQGKDTIAISLERDRFPDFNLRVGNELQLFELVEADRLGRRRSDEYRDTAKRNAAGLTLKGELFDPDEEERAGLMAIPHAIGAKAAKRYKPAPHLLVYVNFCLFRDPPFTNLNAVELAERWREAFQSCWLLWGGFIIRVWPRPAKIRDCARIVAA